MASIIIIFLVLWLPVHLFLFFFLVPCNATAASNNCSALSCGNFHNIKCPFTLKGAANPHNCSTPLELVCDENNRTIYSILSWQNFYVIDINYENQRIRIVDPGLQKDNCSTMPWYSLSTRDLVNNGLYFYGFGQVLYMNCSTRVDSPYYVDTSPCIKASSSSSSSNNTTYLYVVSGRISVRDAKESCRLWMISGTSGRMEWSYEDSYFDIHSNMLNGFELDWAGFNEKIEGCFSRTTGDVTTVDKVYLLETALISNANIIWQYFFNSTVINYITYSSDHRFRSRLLFIVISCFSLGLIGRFVFGTPFVAAFIIYTLRRRRRAMDPSVEDYLHDYRNQMPIRYSYNDVKRMSKNFKEKLGQGGYGSVFKGVLSNNRSIAIKIMTTKGNGQEFINEVASIGRIHHMNVVRLIGFVAERSKRALIYEFMSNGSLEKYIFPQEGNLINPLSWRKIYEIALGIGRGMDYLHRGCDMQILHFDIKPHNILLDENFIPKISDFGLAKLYSAGDSIVSMTAARGTIGYVAPELLYRNIGGVSNKSDVYSFGVMLLEMAGRRKNINAFAENPSQIYFPSWIYDRLNRGKDIEMEDVTDEKEKELAKKMIIVGLWCIQMKPIDRPSMLKVIEMLEGDCWCNYST